jgi:filamentous hemagglutinin
MRQVADNATEDEGSAIPQPPSPEQPDVRFGADENQVRHTFRHADRLGLDRDAVANAIQADLARRGPFSPGANITGNVIVGGVTLEYRAFCLIEGTINVGRITGS